MLAGIMIRHDHYYLHRPTRPGRQGRGCGVEDILVMVAVADLDYMQKAYEMNTTRIDTTARGWRIAKATGSYMHCVSWPSC